MFIFHLTEKKGEKIRAKHSKTKRFPLVLVPLLRSVIVASMILHQWKIVGSPEGEKLPKSLGDRRVPSKTQFWDF